MGRIQRWWDRMRFDIPGLLPNALRSLLACALALGSAGASAAALVDAIEFYNASLDHYFVTVYPDEIDKLDTGYFQGWQRTGLSFKVFDPTTTAPGASPVCRFYGLPEAGLDSHFYSASVAECNEVKQKFAGAWELEADNVFIVYLPDVGTGACPASTAPVYRSWNARVDSNHRYTADPAVQRAMIAKGYIAEGYGPPSMPVAMCSPMSAPPPGGVPACGLSASSSAPPVGASVTLSANCSGNPQGYAWTGCSSAGPTCTTSSSVPGTFSFSVVATNAQGNSAPANIVVTWHEPAPTPQCRIVTTTSSDPPAAGTLAQLTAVCTNGPTSFTWTGCASSSDTCFDRAASAGAKTYSVVAANAGGDSAPASVTLAWQATAPQPLGLCGSFPSTLVTDAGTGDIVRVNTASYFDPPGFAWNGAWTVRFTVPADAASTQFGHVTVAEYVGAPASREATLSRVACDFRPTDPTGNSGPLERAYGNSATAYFALGAPAQGYPGLTPGETYYFSVRNWQPETSSISCSSAPPGRCDAFVDVVVPH